MDSAVSGTQTSAGADASRVASEGTATDHARVPVLDSIRGVAIILVVASHAFWRDFVMGGPVGVAVFFTLSGFLITGLLLDERRRTGRISLGAFYLRRAKRLLPALFVFLAAMVGLGLAAGPWFATWHDTVPVVLYVENFVHIGPGFPHTLGHTWSLSVEEQFYIAFPLLLILVARKLPDRRLPLVLGVTAAIFLCIRVGLWQSGASFERVYYGTDTNAGLILVGAAAAAWCRGHRLPRVDPALWGPVGVAMLVVLGAVADRVAARTIVPILASLICVTLLVICGSSRTPRWMSPGWLVLVGRRSYGLYLWHYPLFHVLQPRMPDTWTTDVILVACAWGLTLLSWHFIEEPVLRWRPRGRTTQLPRAAASAQALG
jgi:peptidoglycan/LPS O-acetylase OafA/YrhL